MAYKTPGVYVEEISTLPASVAEVETAIPAFIGFTKEAVDNGIPITEPRRIKSLVEFQKYYGGAQPVADLAVKLTSALAVDSVSKNLGTYQYYMFDSLRLYFDNGGGDCYIVSVGKYGTAPSKALFKAGLKKLEKYDEPTLIVFPDAAALSADDLHSLQVAALQQCAKMQDRFGVFDLKEDTSGSDTGWEQGVTDFRDKIGINNLKYGTAYTPWIQAGFERYIPNSALTIKKHDGSDLSLSSLPGGDTNLVSTALASLSAAQASSAKVTSVLATVTPGSNVQTAYRALATALSKDPKKDTFKPVLEFFLKMIAPFGTWTSHDTAANSVQLSGNMALEVTSAIDNTVRDDLAKLVRFHREGVTANLADALGSTYVDVGAAFLVGAASTDLERQDRVLAALDDIQATLKASLTAMKTAAAAKPAADPERKKVDDKLAALDVGVSYDTLDASYAALKDTLLAVGLPDKPKFGAVTGLLLKLFEAFGEWKEGAAAVKLTDAALMAAMTGEIAGRLQAALEQLVDAHKIGAKLNLAAAVGNTYNTIIGRIGTPPVDGIFGTATTDQGRAANAMPRLNALFNSLADALDSIRLAAATAEMTADKTLYEVFPAYKSIIDAVRGKLNWLPPSGAIVGIYAAVDRTRGVWKAPANVSLSNVSALSYAIDHDEQERLNVDVNAGKSVNAIRAFSGKGLLVWGARTLAGNDNEWRYVSVRRFYNMVEESIEKSTGWVVFEPNDSGTWIRVRAMISNYLTDLWRRGALAGSKPEQAFFVNVGLGTTMTAVDILEGRMIIEVGMAAVRPTEFIILRFSHKLQEA